MRTPPDLHPDDLAIRESLRDMLVDARRSYGMTQADLAHLLGKAPSTVGRFEITVNWQVSTVQRWAHAVQRRLLLWPDCLPPFDELYLLRPDDDPVAAWAYDREVWIDALVEARRWMGVTQRRAAGRLSISDRGVGMIEASADLLLVTAQRYCRAIDTSLLVDLEEVGP